MHKSWMKPLPCNHHARFVAAEQPWPQSSWLQNLWHNSGISLPEKQWKMNDLRQHLFAAWAVMEQSIDNPIDQCCRRLHHCIRAREWYFNYSLWCIYDGAGHLHNTDIIPYDQKIDHFSHNITLQQFKIQWNGLQSNVQEIKMGMQFYAFIYNISL